MQFLSESGRPLLYSLDDNAYDDPAYLVDKAFDKPYQFGNVNRRNRSKPNPKRVASTKFFAVRPI